MGDSSLLRAIAAIHKVLPMSATARLGLTPVRPDTFDELLARASSVFPPVFLPSYERDGDLYAIHVTPSESWERAPWIFLPHDAAEPVLVASRLTYLPASLLAPPHSIAGRHGEAWDAAEALAAAIPGARPPNRAPLDQRLPLTSMRAAIDPGDVGARLSVATTSARTRQDAEAAVEAIVRDVPDDTFALMAEAMLRAIHGASDAATAAIRVLEREVAWAPRHPMRWFIKSAQSGPEVLEMVRTVAAPHLRGTPLAPLARAVFTKQRTAEVLLNVGHSLAARGDHGVALAQFRNGAAVAGLYGGGLDRAWCERLAEQSERVEPGGLSAALARHAAEVIEQGP